MRNKLFVYGLILLVTTLFGLYQYAFAVTKSEVTDAVCKAYASVTTDCAALGLVGTCTDAAIDAIVGRNKDLLSQAETYLVAYIKREPKEPFSVVMRDHCVTVCKTVQQDEQVALALLLNDPKDVEGMFYMQCMREVFQLIDKLK